MQLTLPSNGRYGLGLQGLLEYGGISTPHMFNWRSRSTFDDHRCRVASMPSPEADEITGEGVMLQIER